MEAGGLGDAPKVGGCKLLWLQFTILVRKCIAVQRRDSRSTFLQLFIPFILILLLFALVADDKNNTEGFNKRTFPIEHAPTFHVGKIPTCNLRHHPECVVPLAFVMHDLKRCMDYEDVDGVCTDHHMQVRRVIDLIMEDNPQIERASLRYYSESDDLNEDLLATPRSIQAAVHFPDNFLARTPGFTIQVNSTQACVFSTYICTTPWKDVELPVQVAVEQAVLRYVQEVRGFTNPPTDLDVSYAQFPHGLLDSLQRDQAVQASDLVFMLGLMMNFVIQTSQLVNEKELKLKLQMRMMGTRDTAMWLSWWLMFAVIAIWCSCMWNAAAYIFDFTWFTKNDLELTILFFFLVYLAFSAWSSAISTVLKSTMSALGIAIVAVFLTWIANPFVSFVFFSNLLPRIGHVLFAVLLPPVLFIKGFADMKGATSQGGDGIQMSEIGGSYFECPTFCESPPCPCDYTGLRPVPIFAVQECMVWLGIDVILYCLLAVYLDQVVPTSLGRSQPWYYFVQPSYWGCGSGKVESDTSTDEGDGHLPLDSDVAAEQKRVAEGGADEDTVRVVNLKKTFGSGPRAFTAVFRVSYGIKNDTLFCLLGHNGAGKTTTFNMLSGMFEPTRGDAFIFGYSVKHQLRAVQTKMGICPQHDVLWPALSGKEHLTLFSGIALVKPKDIPARVASFLASVDLSAWGNAPSRAYSGGMRRRLSVANSLIADPKVVYLDEPSTGMDPVNRRGVWDVIEKAKKNRVVVLTTHAMEEADTLGDMITIMSRGRLHCLGTSLALKNKYGSGYRVDVTFETGKQKEAMSIIKRHLPGAIPMGKAGLIANVPMDQVAKLSPLYVDAESAEAAACNLDLAVSMCSLEEVFIKIAEAAGDPELQANQANKERLEVNCPAGCSPGDTLEISTSDGRAMNVKIPEGVKEGDVFLAEVAAVGGMAIYQVTCPEDSGPGDTVAINAPDGNVFETTVPDGVKPGGLFNVQAQTGPDDSVNQGNSLHGEGADPIKDPKGLLDKTMEFAPVTFKAQWKALSRKNITFQKRQYKINMGLVFFTFFIMAILVLLQRIIGLILGGKIPVCEVKTTSSAVNDLAITTPNYAKLESIIGTLSAVELTDDPECSEENQEDLERFNGFLYRHLCCKRSQCRLQRSEERKVEKLLEQYGCNMTAFNKMYLDFNYSRNTDELAPSCDLAARPDLIITIGNQELIVQNASCEVANAYIGSSCTNRPTRCPSSKKSPTESKTELEINQELADEYKCKKGFSEKLKPYSSGWFAVNATTEEVGECMSDYMCNQGSPTCAFVPGVLKTDENSYEACPWSSYGRRAAEELGAHGAGEPNPRAVAEALERAYASARYAEMPDAVGSLPFTLDHSTWEVQKMEDFVRVLRGDVEAHVHRERFGSSNMPSAASVHGRQMQSTFIETLSKCTEDAFTYCKYKTILDQCPALGAKLVEKKLPYSASSLSDEEMRSLGALRYVANSSAADGFSQVIDAAAKPDEKLGMLEWFTLQATQGEVQKYVSMPVLDCVTTPWKNDKAGYQKCEATREEIDDYLMSLWYQANRSEINYERSSRGWGGGDYPEGHLQAAFDFQRWDPIRSRYAFTVLYNGTIAPRQSDDFPFVMGYVTRLTSTIYKSLMRDNIEMVAKRMGFPLAAFIVDGFDIMAYVASFFIPLIFSIVLVPIFAFQLVSEKELKMREVMVMVGLKRGPYWLINWLYFFLFFLTQLLFVLVIALGFGFKIFIFHDFGLVLVSYLLFGVAIISFSCFLSTLFVNGFTSGVVNVTACFFLVWAGSLLANNSVSNENYGEASTMAYGIIPIWNLGIIVQLMAACTGDGLGQNARQLTLANSGMSSDVPIGGYLLVLALDAVVYMILCIYCDMVLPIGPGVKQHPLFFLMPSYYRNAGSPVSACSKSAGPEGEATEVAEERQRVHAGQEKGVRVLGVKKKYPGAKEAAVKNVQFGIQESECFGLLGSNGAGKSTTIHVLCGLHKMTEGTVVFSGLDIRYALNKIQSAMGVCAQDNLLWDDLTGPEHMAFFCRMRQVPEETFLDQIAYWLLRVDLNSRSTRMKRSRAYSGGMKRRLSFATSFVGNPQIVYLDEPSTGLDPESRRQLWFAVLAAKKQKSIILTTHALEEAEALCDRVGIMAKGLMRTLGTPAELRIRFDQGYKFMMSCQLGHEDNAHEFVQKTVPGIRLKDAINGVRTYEVPKQGVKMASIFSEMEGNKDRLNIKDWGLSHTTLEEVFLHIVADAAAEANKQVPLGD